MKANTFQWSTPTFLAYAKDISGPDYRHLTREDERDLIARVKEGDQEARRKLIESNARLVVSVAKGYAGTGLDIEDLISAGNLGMIKAIDRIMEPENGFNPAKGQWITYLITTINRNIERTVEETARTVRLPSHVATEVWKMQKATTVLEIALGYTPSAEELAATLETTPQHIEELQIYAGRAISLDAPSSETDSRTMIDLIIADKEDPEEAFSTAEIAHIALAVLTERERTIICKRFGFTGDVSTLDEIAAEMGITRERVRQIGNKAMEKMRAAFDGEEVALWN